MFLRAQEWTGDTFKVYIVVKGTSMSPLPYVTVIVFVSPVTPAPAYSRCVKMQVGLLTKTLETQSLLGHGAWPQLMCCDLVAVQVPEVKRGRVGVSEQDGSLDSDQDSERQGGNKLKALGTRGIRPKQAGGCWTQ